MIVDSAIYRDGTRIAAPETLAELKAACRNGAGIAWIGLYRPSRHEFAEIAPEFDLHELAVEDVLQAHRRAELERYGDTLFLVLRSARYLEQSETVEFGVGTVYGMNFDHMPALHPQFGYPLALALTASISLALYVLFKRRNWI